MTTRCTCPGPASLLDPWDPACPFHGDPPDRGLESLDRATYADDWRRSLAHPDDPGYVYGPPNSPGIGRAAVELARALPPLVLAWVRDRLPWSRAAQARRIRHGILSDAGLERWQPELDNDQRYDR